MKLAMLCTVLVLVGPCLAQSRCNVHDTHSDQGLVSVEHRWVQALNDRDQKALECILASEFKDSGVYGQLRDRAQVLADLPHRRDAGQKLEDLEEVVIGNEGVVRGVNHLTTPDGRPLADVRFTDVFVYRDNCWQAVSAQETLVRPHRKG